MHEAARRLCRRLLDGGTGDAEALDACERAQAGVVADLALLRAHCRAGEPLIRRGGEELLAPIRLRTAQPLSMRSNRYCRHCAKRRSR